MYTQRKYGVPESFRGEGGKIMYPVEEIIPKLCAMKVKLITFYSQIKNNNSLSNSGDRETFPIFFINV